jgi:hypothetical protein
VQHRGQLTEKGRYVVDKDGTETDVKEKCSLNIADLGATSSLPKKLKPEKMQMKIKQEMLLGTLDVRVPGGAAGRHDILKPSVPGRMGM